MTFSEHYDLSFTLQQHKPDSEYGYQLILTAQWTTEQFKTRIFFSTGWSTGCDTKFHSCINFVS